MKDKTKGILMSMAFGFAMALLIENPDVVVDILKELKKCKKETPKK